MAERGCRVVAVELGAALAAVARRNLARFPAVELDGVAHLIDTGDGGRVVKRHLTELRVASTIGP